MLNSSIAKLVFTFVLLSVPAHPSEPASEVEISSLLRESLDEYMDLLKQQEKPPHFAALTVQDGTIWSLRATDGTLSSRDETRSRVLDVDIRVGTPELDSTRELRGFSAMDGGSEQVISLPLDPSALNTTKHAIWRALDNEYRSARERLVMIEAERDVKVAAEVTAPDFQPRSPTTASVPVPAVQVSLEEWEPRLVALSKKLDAEPAVHDGSVSLRVERRQRFFEDSEQTSITDGWTHARLSLMARSTGDDGDSIAVFRAFDVHDPSSLPSDDTLDTWATEAISHLINLRAAPRGTPYSGPVLLEGRATAVFFHEVFGHRVEGHRQKSEYEGRTFASKIGEPILPAFIDVYDDPTLAQWDSVDLNGHYAYDDEGVPASRAELVQGGKFAGFLMGRSPLPSQAESNGHGRRLIGRPAVSRMGNTIVEARKTVSREELRKRLIKAAKDQGLDYGYIVSDIDGGFTMTGRVTPNAFNVRANTTYRVFVDGRPDELVRGIDLVGTPLVAFRSVLAADDRVEVFNGMCGAESGWVPVSAVAPGMLIERLEFQLKEKGQERPPLLPKPSTQQAEDQEDGAES